MVLVLVFFSHDINILGLDEQKPETQMSESNQEDLLASTTSEMKPPEPARPKATPNPEIKLNGTTPEDSNTKPDDDQKTSTDKTQKRTSKNSSQDSKNDVSLSSSPHMPPPHRTLPSPQNGLRSPKNGKKASGSSQSQLFSDSECGTDSLDSIVFGDGNNDNNEDFYRAIETVTETKRFLSCNVDDLRIGDIPKLLAIFKEVAAENARLKDELGKCKNPPNQ